MGASSERDLTAFQASLMLNGTPEPIRERLLADHAFTDQMGISVTTTMHVGPTLKITADKFVEAARAALSGARSVVIATKAGEDMRFEALLSDGSLTLSTKDHSIEHPFIDVLSTERDARLRAVESFVSETLVSAHRAEHWRSLLSQRELTPTEYMDFVRDGNATPEALLAWLEGRTNLDPKAMVPDELNYWSTLLPVPDAKEDFDAFLAGQLNRAQTRMLDVNPRLACSRIGYTAASRELVPFDRLQKLDPQDLAPSVDKEDPLSLIFVFEVAAARVDSGPQWEDIGTQALEKLFGNKESANRRYDLLSAGIVIAFARLGRLAAWTKAPLYWRRLAVLSHANVLADALGGMREPAAFLEWAFKQLGAEYYWRTLTDRRDGPLWWPEAIDPHALKALLAARFLRAMQKIDENHWPAPWRRFAEGMRNDNLEPSERVMMAFPGPLSDFVGYKREIEATVFEETAKALRDLPFKIPGLKPFIHLAQLTETELALLRDFVARTVLPPGNDAGLYIAELAVIAHAAGTYRDVNLADALADRAMALFVQTEGIHREKILSILVDAANANADEEPYLAWLARWFERLAYISSTQPATEMLRSVLSSLMSVNPKCRAYLSGAHAVLEIKSAQRSAA